MTIRVFLISVFCFFNVAFIAAKSPIRVALITNSQKELVSEVTALKTMLENHSDEIDCQVLPLAHLSDMKNFDVVWFQRLDSSEISLQEIKARKTIIDYVSKGGKLILSMDAVRLLNAWGIESQEMQIKHFNVVDEGFGRKVGFHAFREHPVFDKMFGGAYTWHGKKDNTCRVIGFFDDASPKAKNSLVIGTLWEYIYYHPQDKILWETSVGKGKILAIGGFLYYNQENFHAKILDQFTTNCIKYMVGKKTDSKAYYWTTNDSTEVILSKNDLTGVSLSKPEKWVLPENQMKLDRNAANFYCDLPTQRCLVVAQEKAGIEEIWTHPFMSLRDFHTYLDIEGVDTLVSLNKYLPHFEIRPNALVRTYQIGKITLKEIITAKISDPTVVVHYQWEGSGLKNLITDFCSNIRFMWPYDEKALGSIYYEWSDAMNAFVVSDINKEFCSLVGANLKGENLLTGRYDGFIYTKDKLPVGTKTDKLQVAASMRYHVENQTSLDMFMIASNTGLKDVEKEYASVMKNPSNVLDESADYYDDYFSKTLNITTPDSLFNEGFKWAVLGSEQFNVHTPGVGTSLMAGYSSSRRGWGGGQKVSGRPGYAWYFGRDAVWSGFAFDGLGDFKTVKQILETLIRFQQVDGKIYHELTSSVSVHFDASDATPLFVNLMAQYLRRSGDIDFVKANINAIHKAMDYCASTDTDGDHLIEISNVGHGWLEGGELYGSHTEFYLVGLWNAALNDASYLSEVVGEKDRALKYKAESQVVNKIINTDFWNPKGYYNYGKKKDGSFTDDLISLVTVPVYFGVTDDDKSLKTIKHFASAEYSADWGVRMINDNYSLFNPTAYHFGSIWPLFTGWASLSEYKIGLYNQAYTHMMANLLNYKTFSLGRAPEVINGLIFKPSGVTLHQCWSETMAIQPVIEGMLGISSDALNHSLTLAPKIPIEWNTCKVNNIRVGNNNIDFSMSKSDGKVSYLFTSKEPVRIQFQPSFLCGTKIKKIKINGENATINSETEKESVTIGTTFTTDQQTIVEITYTEGVAALPSISYPTFEKLSSGFRILEQTLKDGVFEVQLQGRPGNSYSLKLYLPYGYQKMEGATEIVKTSKNIYTATVSFDKTSSNYSVKKLKVFISK